MPNLRSFLLACAIAGLLICTACASTQTLPPASSSPELFRPDSSFPPDEPAPDESSIPAIFIPEPAPESPPIQQPTPEPEQLVSTPPAPTLPEPEPQPEPVRPPVPDASASDYDFSQPVPEREAVELSYFSDAAFVGDSRSEGFYLYGVKRGKNLSSSGLSVFTFPTKKSFTVNGTHCTALEALSAKEYTKVYLGFGVNELGYINANAFYEAYCETIDAVRSCQPYAVVYAQTMAPVNENQVTATGGKKHLNNERVQLYNDLIRKAAQEKCIPLLDIYSALVVDGSLPAAASRDGIHINREYSQKQLDYLRRHTVDFDTLYPQPKPEVEVPDHETTDLPADGTADADSLLPVPDESTVPVESASAASGD